MFEVSSSHRRPDCPCRAQMSGPPLTRWLLQDIFANQFAGPILEGMLGPRPVLWYLNGNTALKSESRQDVHADLAWRHMHHTFGLVVK